MFFVSFYALGMLIAVGVMVGAWAMGLVVAAVALLVVAWRRSRRQPTCFLTTERLYQRSPLSGLRVIPLDQITRCQRYLNRVRTRYGGIEELPTQAVVLTLARASEERFGPMKDFDGLWDLGPERRPRRSSIDSPRPRRSSAAPSSRFRLREDLFLALHTRKGEDTYGPLFLGPTKLIHFTEPLPRLLESILLTVLASPATADQIEPQLAGLVRHPQAGHSVVLERAAAAISVDGPTVVARHDDRQERVTLRPADAERAARFLAR